MFKILSTYICWKKIYKMQHLEGSSTPVLYIGRTVPKGYTSVRVLCEYEALASLRYIYLGSFFLDYEDIRKLSIGTIWNFAKGTGLL
jgi:hypothetical protein